MNGQSSNYFLQFKTSNSKLHISVSLFTDKKKPSQGDSFQIVFKLIQSLALILSAISSNTELSNFNFGFEKLISSTVCRGIK